MPSIDLPRFLPGRLTLELGHSHDYRPLAAFHYAAGPPASWAQVWVIRYLDPGFTATPGRSASEYVPVLSRLDPPHSHKTARKRRRTATAMPPPPHAAATSSAGARTVAVGVLSYPKLSCRPRERWFHLSGSTAMKARFVNAHLRTISRVVVHPQFRSLGLSSALIRCLCERCNTRFVEAIAVMGHVHPLFTRAGMTHLNPARLDEPAYFLLDRDAPSRCLLPEAGPGEAEGVCS
jgi:GNAT superfamily N-acetyltransferase